MKQPPFEPTTCACKADQENCKIQPGHLLPGQLAVIMDHLKSNAPSEYFWSSPGMLVRRKSDHQLQRIRTITPRFENGKCVFFKDGLCSIHSVAPFGCRFFDVHMTAADGHRRSLYSAESIIQSGEYAAERDALPLATHYKGRPHR
jgi:Fe-S-cluster containining protein